LQGQPVLRQIDALVLLEFGDDPLDDELVKILAAEMGIAVGRFDLDHVGRHLEDGNIEGAAAQVEDRDLLALFLVETVGQGGRGRLVDDRGPRGRRSGPRPWWPDAGNR
jgi:hypothetical protein